MTNYAVVKLTTFGARTTARAISRPASERTIFSLRVPITFMHDSDGDSNVGFFGAGALVDHYLDRDGRFALHAGVLP